MGSTEALKLAQGFEWEENYQKVIFQINCINKQNTMEALNYDIMQKIGHEVHIVRETAQNKANFSKVVDDINTLHSVINLYDDIDFTQTDASIHPLFMSIYCRDPEEHPFIRGLMYQMADDDRPDDYFGGITCSFHYEW